MPREFACFVHPGRNNVRSASILPILRGLFPGQTRMAKTVTVVRDAAAEPLPLAPSPKRRGGAEGEQPDLALPPGSGSSVSFSPLSASGRGLRRGVGTVTGRFFSRTFWQTQGRIVED